ncbi:hypothetical protein CONPUDRAFT_147324 [Coniophora puteana RWD-64-598 SS2]|uniref:Uncharacterized protein n=1 Tax=Coniophora puteana (strain RWD-64-598) TaxID=741705 RepID=A0A5M3M812_CONPW|nr:uncharacterized protein CONPUDRAFT_147324 [Coniophora puteana RWD-64-598 SS2]EIW75183.1 hypothetical protein CONPUDRAFT_147324 [Coniophora puteana RWD-64-598 SS2]
MRRQLSRVLRIHWRRPSNAHIHPCLRLPEMLGFIFDFVDDRNTMVSLARVCVCFCAAATDKIPRHINNIYELLLSLPHDLWRLQLQRPVARAMRQNVFTPQAYWTLEFVREMNTEEWNMLIARAKHVKTIGLIRDTLEPTTGSITFRNRALVPLQTVDNALAKCPVPILFPSLEALRSRVPQALLPLVLPPTLRHIDIHSLESKAEEYADDYYRILPSFPACCPQLQSFKITLDVGIAGRFYVVNLSRLYPHFIGQWTHLRSFTGPANEQVLRHLSQLPALENLDLDLSDWDLELAQDQASLTLSRARLRGVNCITCRAISFDSIIRALEVLFGFSEDPQVIPRYPRPVVQRLSITSGRDRNFVTPCSDFIPALIGLISLDALQVFHVNKSSGRVLVAPDTESSVYQLLCPLGAFPNLVDVDFSVAMIDQHSYGRLDAAQVLHLAKAWPNLLPAVKSIETNLSKRLCIRSRVRRRRASGPVFPMRERAELGGANVHSLTLSMRNRSKATEIIATGNRQLRTTPPVDGQIEGTSLLLESEKVLRSSSAHASLKFVLNVLRILVYDPFSNRRLTTVPSSSYPSYSQHPSSFAPLSTYEAAIVAFAESLPPSHAPKATPQSQPNPCRSSGNMYTPKRHFLPEILEHIFDLVDDRNNLVSLTLAAGKIPRNLTDVYELLMCFSRDLWEVKLKYYYDESSYRVSMWNLSQPWVFSFVREITSHDWQILTNQAAKVRTIGECTCNKSSWSTSYNPADEFQALRAPWYRGRKLIIDRTVENAFTHTDCLPPVLFPNLQVLRGQIPPYMLPKVLPSHLQHVYAVSLLVSDQAIPCLSSSCPNLWSFTFVPDYHLLRHSPINDLRLLPHYLAQWDRLRSYSGPADSQLLQHFSQRPVLYGLNLQLASHVPLLRLRSSESPNVSNRRLCRLDSLKLRTSSCEDVVNALRVLFAPLDGTFLDDLQPSLRHFTVLGDFENVSLSELPTILVDLVSPNALEAFCINDQHPVNDGRLTAAQLLELVCAWRYLRELHVVIQGIEFTSLEVASLRRCCPQLQSIPHMPIVLTVRDETCSNGLRLHPGAGSSVEEFEHQRRGHIPVTSCGEVQMDKARQKKPLASPEALIGTWRSKDTDDADQVFFFEFCIKGEVVHLGRVAE